MAKQLTLLFWSAIYGLVLGYIVSALTGAEFNIAYSVGIPMVTSLIVMNLLAPMLTSNTKSQNKQ